MKPSFKKLLHIVNNTFKIKVKPGIQDIQFYVKKRQAYILLTSFSINDNLVNQIKRNTFLPKLARELSHELGHYIVAPPGRRRHPDYGIRERHKGKKQYDVSNAINRHWDLDEAKATLVQNELLKLCGFKSYKHPLYLYGIIFRDVRADANRWWNDTGKIDFYDKIKTGI